MNVEQLSRLAQRAEAVTGRPEDRLVEVHARVRTARRRRATGAVLGAGALVLAVAVGLGALSQSSNPAPERAPRPDDDPAAGSARPLTWTDGFWPSRRIQYGDDVIDTRLDLTRYDFAQMDLTDDGVVVTTTDGRIWLATTDTVEQIGSGGPTHSFLALLVVNTGNIGSLATWVDARGAGHPTLVVYDTNRREVVARTSCGHSNSCHALWVGTDHVYFPARDMTVDDRFRRLDVPTGQVTTVSPAEYAADLRSQSRNLILGDSFDTGAVSDGIDALFVRQGSRLVATGYSQGLGGELPCETDRCRTSAFDTSGAQIRLRVPDGYDRARSFTVFQWLDDDQVAMMAGAGGMGFVPGIDNDLPTDNTGYGDVLVCRISTGRCRLAAPGPQVPDVEFNGAESFDGSWMRIVPDFGTPGTN